MKLSSFIIICLLTISKIVAQPVLNHVYLILDSVTYKAIASNPFLQSDFAAFRNTNVKSNTGSWSGLYLFGKNTYVEFFSAPSDPADSAKSAIALGFDSSGYLNQLKSSLSLIAPDNVFRSRKRILNNVEVDWFDEIFSQTQRNIFPDLKIWVMEYKKKYLRTLYPALDTSSSNVSRATYNQRIYDSTKLVKDITGITISVTQNYKKQLLDFFSQLGCQIKRSGKKTAIELLDCTITLKQSLTGKNHISGLDFSLFKRINRKKLFSISRNSSILLKRKKASWHFTL